MGTAMNCLSVWLCALTLVGGVSADQCQLLSRKHDNLGEVFSSCEQCYQSCVDLRGLCTTVIINNVAYNLSSALSQEDVCDAVARAAKAAGHGASHASLAAVEVPAVFEAITDEGSNSANNSLTAAPQTQDVPQERLQAAPQSLKGNSSQVSGQPSAVAAGTDVTVYETDDSPEQSNAEAVGTVDALATQPDDKHIEQDVKDSTDSTTDSPGTHDEVATGHPLLRQTLHNAVSRSDAQESRQEAAVVSEAITQAAEPEQATTSGSDASGVQDTDMYEADNDADATEGSALADVSLQDTVKGSEGAHDLTGPRTQVDLMLQEEGPQVPEEPAAGKQLQLAIADCVTQHKGAVAADAVDEGTMEKLPVSGGVTELSVRPKVAGGAVESDIHVAVAAGMDDVFADEVPPDTAGQAHVHTQPMAATPQEVTTDNVELAIFAADDSSNSNDEQVAGTVVVEKEEEVVTGTVATDDVLSEEVPEDSNEQHRELTQATEADKPESESESQQSQAEPQNSGVAVAVWDVETQSVVFENPRGASQGASVTEGQAESAVRAAADVSDSNVRQPEDGVAVEAEIGTATGAAADVLSGELPEDSNGALGEMTRVPEVTEPELKLKSQQPQTEAQNGGAAVAVWDVETQSVVFMNPQGSAQGAPVPEERSASAAGAVDEISESNDEQPGAVMVVEAPGVASTKDFADVLSWALSGDSVEDNNGQKGVLMQATKAAEPEPELKSQQPQTAAQSSEAAVAVWDVETQSVVFVNPQGSVQGVPAPEGEAQSMTGVEDVADTEADAGIDANDAVVEENPLADVASMPSLFRSSGVVAFQDESDNAEPAEEAANDQEVVLQADPGFVGGVEPDSGVSQPLATDEREVDDVDEVEEQSNDEVDAEPVLGSLRTPQALLYETAVNPDTEPDEEAENDVAQDVAMEIDSAVGGVVTDGLTFSGELPDVFGNLNLPSGAADLHRELQAVTETETQDASEDTADDQAAETEAQAVDQEPQTSTQERAEGEPLGGTVQDDMGDVGAVLPNAVQHDVAVASVHDKADPTEGEQGSEGEEGTEGEQGTDSTQAEEDVQSDLTNISVTDAVTDVAAGAELADELASQEAPQAAVGNAEGANADPLPGAVPDTLQVDVTDEQTDAIAVQDSAPLQVVSEDLRVGQEKKAPEEDDPNGEFFHTASLLDDQILTIPDSIEDIITYSDDAVGPFAAPGVPSEEEPSEPQGLPERPEWGRYSNLPLLTSASHQSAVVQHQSPCTLMAENGTQLAPTLTFACDDCYIACGSVNCSILLWDNIPGYPSNSTVEELCHRAQRHDLVENKTLRQCRFVGTKGQELAEPVEMGCEACHDRCNTGVNRCRVALWGDQAMTMGSDDVLDVCSSQ